MTDLASQKPWTLLEKRLLDWHKANAEYSNGTKLCNLSYLHWDQDDVNAFEGAHCLLKVRDNMKFDMHLCMYLCMFTCMSACT